MMKIIFTIVLFLLSSLSGNTIEKDDINFSKSNNEISNVTEEIQIEEKLDFESIEQEEKNIEKVESQVATVPNQTKEVIKETEVQNEEISIITTTDDVENNKETKKIQEVEEQQEDFLVIQESEEKLVPVEEKTEEYRYNAEMTQKMIDMINNNQNENMIQYGYTVVVDETAKEFSNPFTYTDERMLIKIQRRCGTIHVYAEDYYLKGNYFGTDCYIY